MSEKDECKYLNEDHLKIKTLEPSPPITPTVYKFAVTPSSPISNNVPLSSAGSVHEGGTSQGSISSRIKLLDSSTTPVDLQIGNSKFLYVKEKLRRPSLLSDISCRTPKDCKSTNSKLGNLKKDSNPNVFGNVDQFPPSVPPNTPSPSGWRDTSVENMSLSENMSSDEQNNSSFQGSDHSSKAATKAFGSESENDSNFQLSTETLPKVHKPSRPVIPVDCSFGSNNALNWSEHLNYLKATRSGHTGLRSVGSAAFIKSFWGHKSQKNVQHHCFLSDITDVRQMEQALLQLLEDFHSGKLRAFAKDCSMEQMQGIREQQERLARLHFDLGAQQDLFPPLSEEGLNANQENMQKLMGSLEQLSLSIEKLQLFNKDTSQ